jgi:citronellol/citronellal dehydrogenase
VSEASVGADRFIGKVAVVTGASRGIGAATALRLAAEGASVALVARSLGPRPGIDGSLEETAAKARTHGVPVLVVQADLSDPASRATVIPTIQEALGKIDILVNNAAAAIYGSMVDMPAKRSRILMEMNYFAPLELIQDVVPGMRAQSAGWIANLTSSAALHRPGPPFDGGTRVAHMGGYGASKSALDRITNAIAMELWGTGIRVNAIRPRKAVLTEGAQIVAGDLLRAEALEPMVEAIIALCECPEGETGRVLAILDLLESSRRPIMALDGSAFSAPPR